MADSPRKSRRKLWWLLLALLVLGGAGGAAYWSYQKREKPIAIQTEKVTRRNLTELVVANGRVQPVVQVKISPEVSGEIIELPVKEGQAVNKGDLLLRIKPDFYLASRRSAEASFKAAEAGRELARANAQKAEIEHQRSEELHRGGLVSDSAYLEVKTAFDVATASAKSSAHQVDVAKAALARAEEELAKTTIYSPITGTVSKLNSQLGERVVGTAMMTGTEVMVVADLNAMEARVDVGEIDVVLIECGQRARLEVDAFRDRKFTGRVTEIANSSKGLGQENRGGGGGGGQAQEATKFEIKIRIQDKEVFRPGMSVTADIETRSRTNVLTVPIQSVTTRLPKDAKDGAKSKDKNKDDKPPDSDPSKPERKSADAPKAQEIVFLLDGDKAKSTRVKPGISDDNFTEIIEGLSEGQEVISGGYKAISRDLDDGKKVKKEAAEKGTK